MYIYLSIYILYLLLKIHERPEKKFINSKEKSGLKSLQDKKFFYLNIKEFSYI